jgi:hypothetical protein
MSEQIANTQAREELTATVKSTGAQIFKAPETPSDMIVTGSALIAIAILISYGVGFFKKRG